MYVRAECGVRTTSFLLPFEEPRVMTFADNDERDLGKSPAAVHDLAGIPQGFQFFLEYCLVLTFRDAVTVYQKIVRKRFSVSAFPQCESSF